MESLWWAKTSICLICPETKISALNEVSHWIIFVSFPKSFLNLFDTFCHLFSWTTLRKIKSKRIYSHTHSLYNTMANIFDKLNSLVFWYVIDIVLVMLFPATDVVTVYVFQEPSLLSSLQDKGLTDVVLHALLVKDVCTISYTTISYY